MNIVMEKPFHKVPAKVGAARLESSDQGKAFVPTTKKAPKVLAVSSGGGHWVQLLRLQPAFAGCQVHYATVAEGYRTQVDGAPFHVVPDCSQWSKFSVLWSALRTLILLLKVRPDVVVSTGAAPGYLALHFGRWVGARTVWIDSIANAEELSLSGKMAGGRADLWLTQWPHLTGGAGPFYHGNVL